MLNNQLISLNERIILRLSNHFENNEVMDWVEYDTIFREETENKLEDIRS